MKRTLVAAVLGLIAPLALSAPAADAVEIGYQGCTPGYWKNHTDNWQETNKNELFGHLYTSAPSNVSGLTLVEALQGGGGPGVNGAAKILARAATAAWLNAAHEGLGYPWRRLGTSLDGRPSLVPAVNEAFASGDRDTMLELAAWLDADNNLGCPLGQTWQRAWRSTTDWG